MVNPDGQTLKQASESMMINEPRSKNKGKATENPYVANDSNFRDSLKYIEPNTKILCPFCDWSSSFAHQFIAIDTDLEDVVRQCKEWSQWKSSDKNCYETKLND